MNRLDVSTECPSCGGLLDFKEGSNAVQCRYCGSNLLVTGRKQVLSYYVEPKADGHLAAASVLTARKSGRAGECRITGVRLYFIPYYRLSGHDLRWERATEDPGTEDSTPPALARNSAHADAVGMDVRHRSLLLPLAGGLLDMFFGESASSGTALPGAPSAGMLKEIESVLRARGDSPGNLFSGEAQLAERYLEKNFLACSLSGGGIYSLGVRTSALALRLFHEETLSVQGRIVAADVSIEAALARGMKAELPESLLYRAVIGRILSLVYFPFWVVELEYGGKRSLSLVDAVARAVVTSDLPLSLYEVLDRTTAEAQHRRAGFRALVCPNCGGDLPVKPDDVVFVCAFCVRAWQIYGGDLREVPYRFAVVRASAREGEAVPYLPFWVLHTERGDGPRRFFLPAFRYRRLKTLSDIATALTRTQPEYSVSENTDSAVRSDISYGCYYDQEDAALLALFVREGMKMKQRAGVVEEKEEISFSAAELVWFPFSIKGPDLVDPFTGRALLKNALL
ncbi:MAG: hypothetical protein IT388_06255 [Nitrospirales bacterium]|nr:hypothetical protein [Nitrospirales bacterium]